MALFGYFKHEKSDGGGFYVVIWYRKRFFSGCDSKNIPHYSLKVHAGIVMITHYATLICHTFFFF